MTARLAEFPEKIETGVAGIGARGNNRVGPQATDLELDHLTGLECFPEVMTKRE